MTTGALLEVLVQLSHVLSNWVDIGGRYLLGVSVGWFHPGYPSCPLQSKHFLLVCSRIVVI